MTTITTLLSQRRDDAKARLDELAAGTPDHRALDVRGQLALEESLDDFLRYDQLVERLERRQAPVEVRVRSEEPVYRPDGRYSFTRDVVMRLEDPGAAERLARHAAQVAEQRATTSLTGFPVPAWLLDRAAPLARPGRPLLDAIDAPVVGIEVQGIRIPSVSAGTVAQAQTASGASVSETGVTSGQVDEAARTVVAWVDLSWQAIDQGGGVFDRFVVPDLVAALETKSDEFAISGSGSSGQPKGILSASGTTGVTWTDGTPTAGEFLTQVASAARQASANRKLPMTAVVMHSRRWYWLAEQLEGTTAAPIVPISLRPPADGPYVATIAGTLGVLIDDNIPTALGAGTNEDRVIVCRPMDLVAALSDPVVDVNEHTDSASDSVTARVIARRYMSFTAERYPSSIAVVSGTGLIAPS